MKIEQAHEKIPSVEVAEIAVKQLRKLDEMSEDYSHIMDGSFALSCLREYDSVTGGDRRAFQSHEREFYRLLGEMFDKGDAIMAYRDFKELEKRLSIRDDWDLDRKGNLLLSIKNNILEANEGYDEATFNSIYGATKGLIDDLNRKQDNRRITGNDRATLVKGLVLAREEPIILVSKRPRVQRAYRGVQACMSELAEASKMSMANCDLLSIVAYTPGLMVKSGPRGMKLVLDVSGRDAGREWEPGKN